MRTSQGAEPPSSPEDWPQMILDCEMRESKLSNWERTFIDNITAQLARGQPLRPGQVSVLDELWERIT